MQSLRSSNITNQDINARRDPSATLTQVASIFRIEQRVVPGDEVHQQSCWRKGALALVMVNTVKLRFIYTNFTFTRLQTAKVKDQAAAAAPFSSFLNYLNPSQSTFIAQPLLSILFFLTAHWTQRLPHWIAQQTRLSELHWTSYWRCTELATGYCFTTIFDVCLSSSYHQNTHKKEELFESSTVNAHCPTLVLWTQ